MPNHICTLCNTVCPRVSAASVTSAYEIALEKLSALDKALHAARVDIYYAPALPYADVGRTPCEQGDLGVSD